MIRVLFSLVMFGFVSTGVAAQQMPGDSRLTKHAWYAEKIELFKAWQIVDEAPDVPVAVLDIEFDLAHPDLVDAFDLTLARDFSGLNFKTNSSDTTATHHGTLVSGVIGANGKNRIGTSGILKRAHLIPLNWGAGTESVLQGIRYAVDHGARIINCSWSFFISDAKSEKDVRDVIEYAAAHDVLLVFAAGNDSNQSEANFPASLTTEYGNVISVGASDQFDRRGPSNSGSQTVDVFAPGKNILVAANVGRYRFSDGTSEAAPIVSGIAALMLQLNPKLHAFEVKEIISKTSDQVDDLKGLSLTGARVNAFRAVQFVKRYRKP